MAVAAARGDDRRACGAGGRRAPCRFREMLSNASALTMHLFNVLGLVGPYLATRLQCCRPLQRFLHPSAQLGALVALGIVGVVATILELEQLHGVRVPRIAPRSSYSPCTLSHLTLPTLLPLQVKEFQDD
eukprot:scaffold49614_cov146-Isochrysis_galbana.AAC.2